MDIDASLAAALGWPKVKYAQLERERRWICDSFPAGLIVSSEAITDLYITGTQLRLREAVPMDGGEPIRRLTRKADVNASTRILTSIYLSPNEFALFAGLPGNRLQKTRHRLRDVAGVKMCVDRFEGALRGLFMAEAEFDDDEALVAFAAPAFALREVTDDARYSGAALALNGLPR